MNTNIEYGNASAKVLVQQDIDNAEHLFLLVPHWNKLWQQQLKSLPHTYWNPVKKQWIMPYTETAISQLILLLGDYVVMGFDWEQNMPRHHSLNGYDIQSE